MIHFLSDLHLAPEFSGINRLFFDYLHEARAAEQVFILGDLFEAWPGDDVLDDPDEDFARLVVDSLRALTESGVALFVQHGNRDFLLGAHFAERAGATLIPDPYPLNFAGARFVLSHGDALCTDDTKYQQFRAQVRADAHREAFLGKPLAERKAIAAAMRQQSEAAKRMKTGEAMDINAGATEEFLRQHAFVTMIHGHTHRPARHTHRVDGISVERWVLADWREEGGEYLVWDGHALTRRVKS